MGHQFKMILDPNTEKMVGKCMCKEDYTFWYKDGACYRLFTQGPCSAGQFLLNSTTCVDVPCPKGYLYFPSDDKCYRLGSQGPCDEDRVVTFDYNVRPSIDGISYHGTCDCSMDVGVMKCQEQNLALRRKSCDYGKVIINGVCHMLYTQGPCDRGQWLMPKRNPKWTLWEDDKGEGLEGQSHDTGICMCRPGYSEVRKMENTTLISITCHPPAVKIAKYLNTDTVLRSLNRFIF